MNNPIFVKIEKYKEIIELVEVIDKKISTAKQTLSELEDIKQKEDEEMSAWQKNLEEINHKLDNIKEQLE